MTDETPMPDRAAIAAALPVFIDAHRAGIVACLEALLDAIDAGADLMPAGLPAELEKLRLVSAQHVAILSPPPPPPEEQATSMEDAGDVGDPPAEPEEV